MNCDKCQDKGLVVILAKDYSDPVFEHTHARCSLPHYGNKPIVLDCECHYHNPLSNDQILDTAMTFLENGMYPCVDVEIDPELFNGWE